MSCNDVVCGTGNWSGPKPGDPNNDLVLTAVGKPGGNQLNWNLPSVNSSAVAYFNLFRATTNDFNTSIRIKSVKSTEAFDRIPNNELKEYFYWIQLVSVNGTINTPIGPESATPTAGVNSLDDLVGGIHEDKLSDALKAKLNNITYLDELINQNELSHASSVSSLEQAIAAVSADTEQAMTYIQNEITERTNAVEAMINSVDAIAVGISENTAAIVENKDLLVNAVETVASDVEVIQGRIDNVGGVTLEQALEASVTADGTQQGYYMMKISVEDANGNPIRKGAFGLIVDQDGSTFAVDASTFKMRSKDIEGNSYTPFLIDNSGIYLNSDVKVSGTLTIGDLAKEPITFIGNFETAPDPASYKKNCVYRNPITGDTYILNASGAWEVWFANTHAKLKAISFIRSDTAPTVPTGGSFTSPNPTSKFNDISWSDGIPSGKKPLYMSSRLFTSDGLVQDANWSTPQLVSQLGSGVRAVFSVNGITGWHTTPATNDLYMATQTSEDGGDTWYQQGGAVLIKGEKGDQGDVGQAQIKGICFKRSFSAPATPTGGSYATPTATDWSDGIPSGTAQLYMTTRIFTSDGQSPQQSVWTTPQAISKDGDAGKGTKVQFSPDGVNSWHDTPTTNDYYMRTGTSTDGGSTWSYAGAVKIKGEKGDKGDTGDASTVPGPRGALTITTTGAGSSATAESVFSTAVPSGQVIGDKVIFVDSTNGNQEWYRTTNNSTVWAQVATYINGNALISDTLYANRIVANSITTDRIGYGQVVGQVSNYLSNTISHSYNSTLTLFTLFITPSSTSSAIYIDVSAILPGVYTGEGRISFIIKRGTTVVGWVPINSYVADANGWNIQYMVSDTIIDSPNTTSSTSYSFAVTCDGGASLNIGKRYLALKEYKR